ADDGDRYFPGTGSPEEQEREDQQHQERLAVLQNRNQLAFGDGKQPGENDETAEQQDRPGNSRIAGGNGKKPKGLPYAGNGKTPLGSATKRFGSNGNGKYGIMEYEESPFSGT